MPLLLLIPIVLLGMGAMAIGFLVWRKHARSALGQAVFLATPYAVTASAANEGMDNPIPPEEVRRRKRR